MYADGVGPVPQSEPAVPTPSSATNEATVPVPGAPTRASDTRAAAQTLAVREAFSLEQALGVLERDFLRFDTAAQKDPAEEDGLVSRDDLRAVRDGEGYTPEQQDAARYLLAHPATFDRVERAADDWGQGDADGLISREDVAAEARAVGAGRPAAEIQAVQTLEGSFDEVRATADRGEAGLSRRELTAASESSALSERQRHAAAALANDPEAFARLDLDGNGRLSREELQIARYAPRFELAPGEPNLPTDPRGNAAGADAVVDGSIDGGIFFRGEGAGAPVFVRVRHGDGGETVIEYWFYRRYNDFRDVSYPIYDSFDHVDDSECVAVRLVDGKPVQVAYSQHGGGVWLPWDEAPRVDGQLVSYPGLGSGANSPYRGSDDSVPGPLNDVHGPAPGESTPSAHVVDGGYRPVLLDGSGFDREDLLDPEGNRHPDSPANGDAYGPGAAIWGDEARRAEPLPARE